MRIKPRLIFFILSSFVLIAHIREKSWAEQVFVHEPKLSTTGVIKDISRNTLRIWVEDEHREMNFIYMGGKAFQKEDRVRIYFQPRSRFIEQIMLMTPVEYKREGQNLGYILKSESL